METESILPLAELKGAMRIDHGDDDGDLTGLREAARKHVEAWCGPLDDFADGVPADIVRAMIVMVQHLYDAEETEAPFGFHDLIGPHRLRAF